MTPYISQIKSYLKIASFHEEDTFHSLLEMLWYYYTTFYPINNDIFEDRIHALTPVLESLSKKRQRKLVNAVVRLCSEQEKAAFLAGLRVGVMLILEILE